IVMTSDSLIAGTVAEVIPRLGERMPTRGRGACANRPMLDERVAAGRASAPGLAQAGQHREVGVKLNLRHPTHTGAEPARTGASGVPNSLSTPHRLASHAAALSLGTVTLRHQPHCR